MNELKNNNMRVACFWLMLTIFSACTAQSQKNEIRAMFYNTENLFDTFNDPKTADDDFTPDGAYKWTEGKYYAKLLNIYKVIAGVGGWEPPDIIGLCEVENRKVLEDLLRTTPLSKYKYTIAHFESPDPRGIDVALLMRSDKIDVLQAKPVYVNFADPKHHTRNILMVKCSVENSDTLFVFINHWPSRRGGESESKKLRYTAALRLKSITDSVLSTNVNAKMLIMGDFNDEPTDASITGGLKATSYKGNVQPRKLYNLMLQGSLQPGTISFRGQWQIFDQVIVSGSLLNSGKGIYTNPGDVHIFAEKFILQYNDKNLNFKPLPTYQGPKYIGGFSDHLPVYVSLFIKK